MLVPALALLLAACAISRQQEVQMGADYAAQVEAQLPIMRDAEINRYLGVLGDSLARIADDRALAWHFRLVNSREVNAFAIPGGHVYVTRGLVERTATMSQLAGVVAHEIAHVTRRHAVKQLEKAQRTDVTVSLVCILTGACGGEATRVGIDLGRAALIASYSRADEAESDADAVRILVRAGIHPAGIPELFETLLAERRTRPAGVEAWFATHPTEESRIATTRRQVEAIPAATLAGLTRTTQSFEDFRRRVRSASVASR